MKEGARTINSLLHAECRLIVRNMKMLVADCWCRRFVAFVAFVCVSVFLAQPAFAKRGSTSIQLYLIGRPADAIVLARFEEGQKNHLVIEKSYFGALHAGDKMLLSDADRKAFDIPADDYRQNLAQRFLLFLVHAKINRNAGYDFRVNDEWSANFSVCRRIVDGKVYDWLLDKPYRPQLTREEAEARKEELIPDEFTGTLAKAEGLVSYGLLLREHWAEAKASTDSARKLELLRPFLIPTEDGMFNPYMVWAVTREMLDEADKAGAAAIPFLEGLLNLPCYQASFAPEGWIGFGAQQRIHVEQRLHLQRARLMAEPAQKLAELAPLFVPAQFDSRAGCDGEGLLTQILDKALAEVGTAGGAAIPFLQELLTRPYFQTGYPGPAQSYVGTGRREKIEAALARLQGSR